MTYADLIQKLFKVNLFGGVKLGLQNARQLQKVLNFPDQSYKTIHVAGTNGKGSVSIKIARALQCAGYKVGLYTSPHISNFRERIQINGFMITEEAVESLLSYLFRLTESIHLKPTFFELTTFLALMHFAREKVDVAVLETGLGGRLDATNVILPCLSVITSISLDHVDILGNTIEEIAKEKGGIIKEGVPVVIGPHVPFEILSKMALHKQSHCQKVECISPLFEEENCQIAQTALSFLSASFSLSQEAIQKGLKAKQPCRFEIIPGEYPIILDVAHNPDGLQHLFQTLTYYFPHYSVRILFGISKNKDLKLCLELIAKQGVFFHLVEAKNGRGAPRNELLLNLEGLGIPKEIIFVHDSVIDGVLQAVEAARQNREILLICGSFFIMSEARSALGIDEPRDLFDLNERGVVERCKCS